MSLLRSFEPLIGRQPKVLILGSMPGVKSLQDQQYYAHPRNAFWPIMGELFSIEWSDSYARRVEQIKQLPVIIWDVLQSCHREGSLDSNIRNDQLQANAIPQLLLDYPTLRLIVFNGATSEKMFKRHLFNQIAYPERYTLLRLPSSSPAHAGKSFQQKLAEWSAIRQFCN
jgi:double-stranded uracil-DNA glycosylase